MDNIRSKWLVASLALASGVAAAVVVMRLITGNKSASSKRRSLYEFAVPLEKILFFRENGFVVLDGVVGPRELRRYLQLVEDMASGKISCQDKRGDLGGHTARIRNEKENTLQIVHPYVLTSRLDECEHFRKGRDICNQLFGEDVFTLDCSQILVKFPQTKTETPWHQDQSYYPDKISDKRAANVWLALEDCTIKSGCLSFYPRKLCDKSLRRHCAAGNGKGALTCDPGAWSASDRRTVPMAEQVSWPPRGLTPIHAPAKAGSVVVFANYTFHYGNPNNSALRRPAFVAQYRPGQMVQACRCLGFDHGKFQSHHLVDAENRTKARLKLSQTLDKIPDALA